MRILKVKFIEQWEGFKAGSVIAMQEWKYFELKKLGIVRLVAGDVSELWYIKDEEE